LNAGEWLALAAFAASILGGLMRVVWLLAQMKERLDALCTRVEVEFAALDHMVRDHEVRLVRLEEGPKST
jgi:hypothetical protein